MVTSSIYGCGKQAPIERKYIKELCWGHWQGKSITIMNHSANNKNSSNAPFHSRLAKYGQMQCLLNPDDTYKLDLDITNDIYGRKTNGEIEYGNVLIPAGYKLMTTGHFAYIDSTVVFYNYHNKKELNGILYSYDENLYLTYIDKYQNEWSIQFERIN